MNLRRTSAASKPGRAVRHPNKDAIGPEYFPFLGEHDFYQKGIQLLHVYFDTFKSALLCRIRPDNGLRCLDYG